MPPGGALIWTLEAGEGARSGPEQPEQLIVDNPPVGEYVAKIVNRVATGSTWELGVRRLDSEQKLVSSGKTEAWTLSCESPDGKTVYETRDIVIDRGETQDLNLRCGGKKVKSKAARIKAAKRKKAACVRKARKIEKARKRKAEVSDCKRTYRKRLRRIRKG